MSSAWKLKKEALLFREKFLTIKTQEYELPDGRVHPSYYTVEFQDWVNVVALTPQSELILVEQYRPPAQKSFLEIPGGGFSPREDSSFEEAARRELREETGFVSSRWSLLGSHYPNPALQTNQMHTFLALDCEKVGDPELDPLEDLVTEIVPVSELPSLVLEGRMAHSIVMASILLSFKHLGLSFP